MSTEELTIEHTHLRATKKTRRILKIIAAHTAEKQYRVLERLVEKEAKKLNLTF